MNSKRLARLESYEILSAGPPGSLSGPTRQLDEAKGEPNKEQLELIKSIFAIEQMNASRRSDPVRQLHQRVERRAVTLGLFMGFNLMH